VNAFFEVSFGDSTGEAEELRVVEVLRHLLSQFEIGGSELVREISGRTGSIHERFIITVQPAFLDRTWRWPRNGWPPPSV
jgi:hypothetical protein